MDARFHELAETGGREKGRKRNVGIEAWVLLFLSVLFVNYILLTAYGMLVISGNVHRDYEFFFGEFCVGGMILSGWPAIIHYRMRKLFPIRCTVFFAALSGIVLAVSPIYCDLLRSPRAENTFLNGLYIVMGLLFAVGQAEFSAVRARYAYSEKTDQWLRCYIARKRLVVDFGKPHPETFAEILALESTRKRFGIPHLALFLDSEPDGTHYLCTILHPEKRKFFSLKLSPPKVTSVVLPVDLHQIEHLRDRFGEFKKAFFMPFSTITVGDAIRKQAKQGMSEFDKESGPVMIKARY